MNDGYWGTPFLSGDSALQVISLTVSQDIVINALGSPELTDLPMWWGLFPHPFSFLNKETFLVHLKWVIGEKESPSCNMDQILHSTCRSKTLSSCLYVFEFYLQPHPLSVVCLTERDFSGLTRFYITPAPTNHSFQTLLSKRGPPLRCVFYPPFCTWSPDIACLLLICLVGC